MARVLAAWLAAKRGAHNKRNCENTHTPAVVNIGVLSGAYGCRCRRVLRCYSRRVK